MGAWESGLPVAMTCGPLISASDFWEKLEVAAQQAGQPMSECDRVGTMAGCSRLYSTMASHVVARRCVECFGLQSTKAHGQLDMSREAMANNCAKAGH